MKAVRCVALLRSWAGPAEGTRGKWRLGVKFVVILRKQEVGCVERIEQGSAQQLGASSKVTQRCCTLEPRPPSSQDEY